MRIRKLGSLLALPLLLTAVGCGDDEVPLRLQPFEQNRIELQLNQQHIHKVRLSRKVSEKTFVDLDFTTHGDFLEIPESVVIKVGEDLATVTVVGKAVTPNAKGQFMQLTFTLRGTNSTQEWSYRVAGTPGTPGPPPDAGVPTPQPDTGAPAPDAAAPAPDAAAPDAGAPAPDAAPDA